MFLEMSRRYNTVKVGSGSYNLLHNKEVVATIEQVHQYPEFYKNIFGKLIKNNGQKHNTRYVITNLPGVSDAYFRSVKGAANHAAFHHLNNSRVLRIHPIHSVGQLIEQLGTAIHKTAADHRMTDHDQEKLLDISKHHAQLRKKYQEHFL